MNNIKIHKRLLWLKPYLILAEPYLHNMYKLTRLSSRIPRHNQIQRCHAQISRMSNGEFRITMYVQYYDAAFKLMNYSKIDMLTHLAHELAHLDHWNHTPHHKKLEAKLTSSFMHELLLTGYSSEEEELANQHSGRSPSKAPEK